MCSDKVKNQILLLLCCLFPLLSGCAATNSPTTNHTVVYDNRSFTTINQDRHITEHAQTLIDHSKILKGRAHISVASFNHVILMVGQAQTSELRDYAYKLLSENIKKAQHIYNEVTVSGASSFLQRTNDMWITTKAKAAMLTTQHLRSTQVKVVTEDSTIYLLGLVSHRQGELAGDIARRIPGVKKVVKIFQYT